MLIGQHASLWHLKFGIVLRHWDKLLFVSITVVQVTLTHLMLVRFQHEQLLQGYRHTHEAHIFVAVGSAPTPATNSPSPSWLFLKYIDEYKTFKYRIK